MSGGYGRPRHACGVGAVWSETLPALTLALAVSLALVAALTVFRRPLRSSLALAGRTGVGLLSLAALAPALELMGVSLGINLLNALTLAVLGAPGFGLLLMLRWVLR